VSAPTSSSRFSTGAVARRSCRPGRRSAFRRLAGAKRFCGQRHAHPRWLRAGRSGVLNRGAGRAKCLHRLLSVSRHFRTG
jgi:hypothetical protein